MTTNWPAAYDASSSSIPAVGLSLSDSDMDVASPQIQALLTDALGVAEVKAAMTDATTTDFAKQRLEKILTEERSPEEWRVGEALAEHHLVEDESCYFPWPSGRDQRNPGSSGGGVDLVGFHSEGEDHRLAFAEVKTSSHNQWPPSIMTGRHGLERQLEGLRDDDDRRNFAIKYLAIHAISKDWFPVFQSAWANYVADTTDIRLFGTLVHISQPNHLDIRTRAKNLAKDCPSETKIKLFGIYLPKKGLQKLAGQDVVSETS